MADRSIVVRLQAVVSGFKEQMGQAGKAAGDLADKVEASQQSLNRVGGVATKAGLLIGVGLGLAAKAAIDWESAWAGVTKTVDGSASELATLEGQLRGMAKTLPATHSEIAAVAEAAGQLGVKTKDVASFTKVMIDLGETTNLTADEAATSLAQLMNVMGTAPADVGRLGAAIVDLGNKGASTERDVVQMGQRIAAAGKSVGMAETDVLGFASALASAGVEAEAGGTAISQTFKEIDKAARKGGASLDLIAKTAGMSSEAFTKAWKEDAAGATVAFVEGLGDMQAAGQDANGVLDQLGMTGMRQSDSIMRLAQAGDLLADNIRNSSAAWEENTALVAEASKRYETTESKIKIAWNNIQDSAITAGGVMLPVISDMATKAAGLAEAFGDLPDGMQRVAVGAGVMAAGGLLAVGGLAKMLTTGLELRSSLKELATISPKAGAGLKTVGKVAAVAAVALTAAAVANAAVGDSWKKGQASADDLAHSMANAKAVALDLDDAFQFTDGALLVTKFDGVGAALKRALDPSPIESFGDVMNSLFPGQVNTLDRMRSQFGELDKAITSLASGGMGEQAAAQFAKVAESAAQVGIGTDRLVTLFPQYKAQLEGVAQSLGVVGLSTQDYVDWMGGKVPPAIQAAAAAADSADPTISKLAGTTESAAEAAKKAADAARELANAWLSMSGSEIGLEAAIDAATESLKENKANLDINTEGGRANKSALDDIATAALNLRDAQAEAGVSTDTMNASTARARDAFIKTADQMGLTGAEAAALAVKYGLVPATVTTNVSAPGATISAQQVVDFQTRLNALPAEKRAAIVSIFEAQGYNAAITALNNINGKVATTYIRTVYTTSGAPVTSVKGVNQAGADGAMFDRSGFGLVRAYRSGGFPRDVGSIGARSPGVYGYAGPAGVIMNEDGSGPWEGIVSGHPGKRGRSRAITEDIAKRLGGRVEWMADGGVMQYQLGGGASDPSGFARAVVTALAGGSASQALTVADLRAALDGATLNLDGVDYLSNRTAAKLSTAIRRR